LERQVSLAVDQVRAARRSDDNAHTS
jgi:hypothetical protein